MKKLLALLVCGFMALSLVACSNNETPTETTTPTDTTEPTETGSTTTGSTQMGVGQSTTISATDFSADAEGSAQFNTTYVLLVVGEDGKIADLKVDVAQNTTKWDGAGVVTDAQIQGTKTERGEDYGMRSASPIGAEWFEQAQAFEEYCVGKSVDEVLNMELDAENHNGPVDLTSSCTMDVTEFLNAIADANEHLLPVEGAASYHLGSSTTNSPSDASADANGSIQYNTTYAGVALDANGAVVAVDIDVAQNTAHFDTTGVVVDADPIDSKQDRKDDYGMRSASPIGAEWFEQAEAFEEYCVGQTPSDIAGMELDTENHGGPVDLTSTCTIAVTDFINAITAACAE